MSSTSWLLKAANVIASRTSPRQERWYDVDRRLERARLPQGTEPFGEAPVRDGLAMLLDDLRQAPLSPLGARVARDLVGTYLAMRRKTAETIERQTGLLDQSLHPPLIVLGLPRTGTTYLHRLLAEDPAHRAMAMWEWFPVRPVGTPANELQSQRRSVRVMAWLRSRMDRDIDRKHFIRGDLPEECMWGLGVTFQSLVYWMLAPVYTYAHWYARQSRHQKYVEYRWLLQLLQSTTPDLRLTLKAPAHLDAVDAILTSIPDALLVQTHRDPLACVPSMASLTVSSQQVLVETNNLERVGRTTVDLARVGLERNAEDRAMHPDAVHDVLYDDLVRDPIGTVQAIYERFGLPMTDAFEHRLRAHVAANPKHRRGAHTYDLRDYGLSAGELAELFRGYRESYDLI
ncbi:MAG: sulfotransferase [Bacteroidota bacterium]